MFGSHSHIRCPGSHLIHALENLANRLPQSSMITSLATDCTWNGIVILSIQDDRVTVEGIYLLYTWKVGQRPQKVVCCFMVCVETSSFTQRHAVCDRDKHDCNSCHSTRGSISILVSFPSFRITHDRCRHNTSKQQKSHNRLCISKVNLRHASMHQLPLFAVAAQRLKM